MLYVYASLKMKVLRVNNPRFFYNKNFYEKMSLRNLKTLRKC